MKTCLILRKLRCSIVIFLFALAWPGTPVLAADDAMTHHIECRDTWEKDKAKCDKILERSMETEDAKAAENLFTLAIKCRAEIQAELDRCRDPRRVMIFVKNEAWRKNNENALSNLSKVLEAADDQCNAEETKGIEKCEAEKSAKKREKCIDSVGKKHQRCLQNAEKAFLAGFKKLNPPTQAMEGGGLKAVQDCHEKLRKSLKTCNGEKKCINKGHQAFNQCIKANTKNAQFKKGSSFKKLAASIQKVIDASTPIYRKCSTRAGSYEKEEVAKAKEKGTLKQDAKKITAEAEKMKQDCYADWQITHLKALEAQIRQHFVD